PAETHPTPRAPLFRILLVDNVYTGAVVEPYFEGGRVADDDGGEGLGRLPVPEWATPGSYRVVVDWQPEGDVERVSAELLFEVVEP
ncbi:MAG: hypothetical protein O3C27_14200, partial [Actinomycetota bacterium]|nr:hypothetical protein [Actinomycetota bacterium]